MKLKHPLKYGRTWLSLLIADSKKDRHEDLSNILDNIEKYSKDDIKNLTLKPIHKKNLLKLIDYISIHGNPLVELDVPVLLGEVQEIYGDLYQLTEDMILGGFVLESGNHILKLDDEICVKHKFMKYNLDHRFVLVQQNISRTDFMKMT